MDERRRHSAVDAAAQSADDVALRADLGADAFDRFLDEVAGRPVAATAADPLDEVGQDIAPVLGMHDLGMELQAIDAARFVGDGGQGRVAAIGHGEKAVGQALHAVAMAHPHGQRRGQAGKERAFGARTRPGDVHLGAAVFALAGRRNLAAQAVRQQLQAVAETQHGHAAFHHRVGQCRRAGIIDAVRATREDDPLRLHARQHLAGAIPGNEFGVHVDFAHAAADKLAVLAAVIEHGDGLVLHTLSQA